MGTQSSRTTGLRTHGTSGTIFSDCADSLPRSREPTETVKCRSPLRLVGTRTTSLVSRHTPGFHGLRSGPVEDPPDPTVQNLVLFSLTSETGVDQRVTFSEISPGARRADHGRPPRTLHIGPDLPSM